ncbi:MAG TPA: hypothetical protein VGM86_33730 [Thermoanaerobaculia bacterium]|jgi:hypothetical protein
MAKELIYSITSVRLRLQKKNPSERKTKMNSTNCWVLGVRGVSQITTYATAGVLFLLVGISTAWSQDLQGGEIGTLRVRPTGANVATTWKQLNRGDNPPFETPGFVPTPLTGEQVQARPGKPAELSVVEVQLGGQAKGVLAIRAFCPANTPCCQIPGLTASEITFEVVDISWQAGAGWPVYHSYCPRDEYKAGMFFRDAKVHQIVPRLGGFYFVGCYNPGRAVGTSPTAVCFGTNDDRYDDNQGGYVVLIYSWK